MKRDFDVIVIGAGPAGLAAASTAAAYGASVAIVDDNPYSGGQIWRGGAAAQQDERARHLWTELQARQVTVLQQARVLYAPEAGKLLLQTPRQAQVVSYCRLVLATGARELLLPFPGWTLPGVSGAGGLQALSKGGYPVQGKRVVVAGSGPLLLAVAATLQDKGATVSAIVEQAGSMQLARFALGLFATPEKLKQAMQLGRKLSNVPYYRNSYISAAHGAGTLESVSVRHGGSDERWPCELLACGYGLLPNTELAASLGCTLRGQAVQVDEWQQTSQPNIFCAGESTGIGGVDLALVEGRIAGLAAVERQDEASLHFADRARWQRFAMRLERGFALRPELHALADDGTIVCRCEDVCHGELKEHRSWRSAKLHTRCGMGPCQGRICGGATGLLYGWRPDSVRVPVVPARIDSIITS
ncbi:NAD(P)/FAD-dependent oxidoreductase [Pseudoduganella violacea]|uniref:NADPH-dependent 2,4-dienoyl-CoA reductase/sulfur reductase-like enzyme n=1 Tax=Pseudoduganella violacea TaxID=1715466 RepID=A0A7W5FT63_9BURK|nr:FAD/NAD(P)-binding oxidoreductase [Pseudoduganella violacea]MBB3118297.1 NADPH-dependent 2,4-dienoyl-CoA reductase/sulfur reductase-like enzyme [Pseudoduganella violacea]